MLLQNNLTNYESAFHQEALFLNMMNNWFTIERINQNTYALSEYRHWEENHSYLLLGGKENLLIDSGLGIKNIANVVSTITNQLTVVVATHVH